MYERITDENPYEVPMRIYPAVHYTMGGLWVDYHLMSNVPGLFVLGEANFSDHGANRLGASALMQGLADGYFVIRYTLANYLAGLLGTEPVATDDDDFGEAEAAVSDQVSSLLVGQRAPARSTTSIASWARSCGSTAAWPATAPGSRRRCRRSPRCARSSGRTSGCSATSTLNQSLEKAGRVADFFELGELMVRDALHREESCGGHFREEHQTEDGEALRDDEQFAYVAAWEWGGDRHEPSCTGNRSPSSTSSSPNGPTSSREHASHEPHAARLAPGRPAPPGRMDDLRGQRHRAGDVASSRCSTWSTSA